MSKLLLLPEFGCCYCILKWLLLQRYSDAESAVVRSAEFAVVCLAEYAVLVVATVVACPD